MRAGAAVVVACAVLAVLACGGAKRRGTAGAAAEDTPAPSTPIERMIAMLPQGAQVVVEVDLARLRANPVIGAAVARALAGARVPRLGGGAKVGASSDGTEPAAPPAEPAPLATVDAAVLVAYGVGTASAAAVTLLASATPIEDTTRVARDIYAVGPEAWTAPIAERAALLESGGRIRAQPELLALRARAMPEGAPGAALRVTARLPFDARVALARMTGLEAAPAQLSIWGDVVDDLAIVIDADPTDPGDRRGKQATARLTAALRGALASLAAEPFAQGLGVSRSLHGAKLVARGAWVRAIIAIGPDQLKRVAGRATAFLEAEAKQP